MQRGTNRRVRRGRGVLAPRAGISLLVTAGVFACATEPPPLVLDPSRTTEDGLQAVTRPRVADAWIDPKAEFRTYHSIFIAPVVVEDRPGGERNQRARNPSRHFALTDRDREALATEFADVFGSVIEREKRLELVPEPGPGVLLLRAGLVDVTKLVRTEEFAGRSTTFSNSTGALTLVLDIEDSLTGESLARVVDRRNVQSPGVGATGLALNDSATRTADLRRVFKRWAELLDQRLVQLQDAEAAASAPAAESAEPVELH